MLPSDPEGVALAGPVAGDPVTDAIELAELLDVDVEELAQGRRARSGAPVRPARARPGG